MKRSGSMRSASVLGVIVWLGAWVGAPVLAEAQPFDFTRCAEEVKPLAGAWGMRVERDSPKPVASSQILFPEKRAAAAERILAAWGASERVTLILDWSGMVALFKIAFVKPVDLASARADAKKLIQQHPCLFGLSDPQRLTDISDSRSISLQFGQPGLLGRIRVDVDYFGTDRFELDIPPHPPVPVKAVRILDHLWPLRTTPRRLTLEQFRAPYRGRQVQFTIVNRTCLSSDDHRGCDGGRTVSMRMNSDAFIEAGTGIAFSCLDGVAVPRSVLWMRNLYSRNEFQTKDPLFARLPGVVDALSGAPLRGEYVVLMSDGGRIASEIGGPESCFSE